jgi:signal peptidase I
MGLLSPSGEGHVAAPEVALALRPMNEQKLVFGAKYGGNGGPTDLGTHGRNVGGQLKAAEVRHDPGVAQSVLLRPPPPGGAEMGDGLDIDLRQEPPQEPESGVMGVLRSWGPPLLAVLVIRSILIEPFQIPSGSMVPTLAIGDFIVVSKFAYGLRVPFTNIEILELGEPQRGDIDVFIHPPTVSADPWCWVKRIPKNWTLDLIPFMPGPDQPCTIDYVKRLVGMPGDTIEVRDDVLYVNGEAQAREQVEDYDYVDVRGCYAQPMKQYRNTLDEVEFTTLQTTAYGMHARDYGPTTVPEGHYFFMGDNRDNSADGRYWGFVPRSYIRGKAEIVWLSFDPCGEGGVPGLGAPRGGRIGQWLE